MSNSQQSGNNGSVPGLIYPTTKSLPGGNPQNAAIVSMNSNSQKQTALSNAVGGKKRVRGGATSQQIVVPQYNNRYTVTNGAGTGPNAQIAKNAGTSTQGAENAKYDQYATVTSGGKKIKTKIFKRKTQKTKKHNKKNKLSKKHKGGSNPNWNWGCYSGGKKSRKH